MKKLFVSYLCIMCLTVTYAKNPVHRPNLNDTGHPAVKELDRLAIAYFDTLHLLNRAIRGILADFDAGRRRELYQSIHDRGVRLTALKYQIPEDSLDLIARLHESAYYSLIRAGRAVFPEQDALDEGQLGILIDTLETVYMRPAGSDNTCRRQLANCRSVAASMHVYDITQCIVGGLGLSIISPLWGLLGGIVCIAAANDVYSNSLEGCSISYDVCNGTILGSIQKSFNHEYSKTSHETGLPDIWAVDSVAGYFSSGLHK